ncbi:hypothetical protein GGI21_000698, partial [Coemansia aciculifera]
MSVASSTRLSASSELSSPSAANDSFVSNDETSGAASEQSGNDSSDEDEDDNTEPASKRFKPSSGADTAEDGLSDGTLVDFAEHQGQRYYVGDHVLLEDTDNSSGTVGTSLPAVGHIQQLERDAQTGKVGVLVVWYVHPQLTPHPPLMEFYKNALLRTMRQTVVPLDHVKSTCFVVQPSEAMVGHPIEYAGDAGGVPLFVCDSRFNDKGGFIQRIKRRTRGFWPVTMDQKRQDMLTNMVPWSGGPRELEKSLVPIQATNDDRTKTTPQTRRTLRLTIGSTNSPAAAAVPATQHGLASSAAAMNLVPGSQLMPQQAHAMTMPISQSQYLA